MTHLPFYANPLGFWDPRLIHSELFVSDQCLSGGTRVPPNRPKDLTPSLKPTTGQDIFLEAVCQVRDQHNEISAAIHGLTD